MSKLVKRKDRKGGRNVVELSADILKRHKNIRAVSQLSAKQTLKKCLVLLRKRPILKMSNDIVQFFLFAQITIHFLFYFLLFLNHGVFYETT